MGLWTVRIVVRCLAIGTDELLCAEINDMR